MLYKVLYSFVFGLLLSNSLELCFSMEDGLQKEHRPSMTPEQQQAYLLEVDEEIGTMAKLALSTGTEDEKLDYFTSYAKKVSSKLEQMPLFPGEECHKGKGFIYYKLGNRICHLLYPNGIPDSPTLSEVKSISSNKHIEALQRIVHFSEVSLDFVKVSSDTQSIDHIKREYFSVLKWLATVLSLKAQLSTELSQIIDLYDQAVNCIGKMQKISPSETNYDDILNKFNNPFNVTFSLKCKEYDTICNDPKEPKTRLEAFTRISKDILPFLNFLERKDFTVVARVKKTNDGSKCNSLTNKIHKHQGFFLLKDFAWPMYCGALRGSSTALLELAAEKPEDERLVSLCFAREKKAEELLITCIDEYRKHVYLKKKHKIKKYAAGSERERQYILAILDDILGDPKPLNAFFKMLRQEQKDATHQRHIQKIKEHQQSQELKRLEAEGAEDEANRKLAQTRAAKPLAPASSDTHCFEVEGPRSSAKPKKSRKVKKREEPKGTSSIVAKVSSPLLTNNDEEQVIVLSQENHLIFRQLTGCLLQGETRNWNISLHQIESLLASLGCKITPAKGSHGKATASNGAEWTTPPDWGNDPMPYRYRKQLNKFLQHPDKMGLDPEKVVGK